LNALLLGAWRLGAVEMLRRVVRKAVLEASKSLPSAETRGSPLLTVVPRVFLHTLCNCGVWLINALRFP
jgi:hypothetical protein